MSREIYSRGGIYDFRYGRHTRLEDIRVSRIEMYTHSSTSIVSHGNILITTGKNLTNKIIECRSER